MSRQYHSETWAEAILGTVRSHRGTISLQEIYAAMENHPVVTAYHKELVKRTPRFHLWIGSLLTKLVRKRAVSRVGLALYTAVNSHPEPGGSPKAIVRYRVASAQRRSEQYHYKLTPEQQQEVVAFRSAGESLREIAKAYGVSHQAIANYCSGYQLADL
jgi:hypothetical protein